MFVPSAPRRRALPIALIAFLVAAFALIAVSNAEATYLVPNFTVTAAPTQAAGHPKITVSIDPDAAKADSTGGDDLKDLTIDAPAGLQLNQAAATSKCTDATFKGSGGCPTASQVGTATVKWRRSSISTVTFTGNVYVLTTPAAANTAALGLVLKATGYKTQAIPVSVSNALPVNSPTRVSLTNVARNIQSSIGLSLSATIDQIDIVLNAKANSTQSGPYFTLNPSACTAAATQATLTSYANVVVSKSSSFTPTGCPTVLFAPTANVAPTVSNAAAPTGLNTSFTVPSGELTTQQSAVKNITVASPAGVLLNMPTVSSTISCPEANLIADTCPLASKIGVTSFTFWGAAAASGDVYMTAKTAGGFNIAAVSRGANGVVAITRGAVSEIDSNGDLTADRVQVNLDSLPTATWSAASLNITSLLLRNNCPTGSSTTTIQSASAATVVKTGTWSLAICDSPPDTAITSGPNGPTNQTSPQFAFNSIPAGSTFECQIDGAAFATCLSPYTLPALAQGSHVFCVRAVGAFGADASPACQSFSVDTVAPVVNILTNGPSITFTASDSSPITGTTCQLNASAAVSCTSPWTIQVFADLSYSFTICATDAAGNSGCSTRIVDVNPPIVTLTSGPTGYVASTNASFAFSVDEPNVSISCSLDSSAFAACSSPVNYSGLSNGSHTFCVRAVDAAGNASSPACRTWTVDTVAPIVVITSPSPGSIQSTSATFTWTVSDSSPISTVTCRFDGGAAVACSSPWSLTGIANGSHTAQICATDAAGNIGCGTLSWNVPPPSFTVTITSGRTGTGISTTATFAFVASTSPVTFACSFDGSAYSACTSPITYTALSQGSHTFCVRGTDSTGNQSLNTPCQSFTVGGAIFPPTVTRTAPTANPTTSTSQTLAIVLDSYTPIAEASLDGGAYATVPSLTVTLTGLADGTHTYSVRGVDADGNRTSATTVSWTVDTTPPPAPSVSGPSGVSSATTVTIAFSNSEAGVTCQGSRDGAAFAFVTSPVTLTNITDGAHTYSVRCTDAVGNVSAATTIAWTASIEPPPPLSLVRTSPLTSPSNQTTASFTVSGLGVGSTLQRSLDGGAFVSATSPINFSGLPNGAHVLTVRAVDGAGNLSSTSSSVWTVDTVAPAAPSVTLTSPTSSPTTQTSATVAISPAEAGGTLQGSLDGAAFAAVTSPVNLTGLVPGTHTYSARQVDAATNIGSAAAISWTISTGPADTVAPSINGLSSSQGSGGATITYSASDDSGATPTCTPASGTTFPFYGTGALIVTVTCLDAAGNRNSTSLNIGSNGPAAGLVTTLSGGPDGNTIDPTPTFSYTVNRATSGSLPCSAGQTCAAATVPLIEFNCTIDGTAVACSEGSFTPEPLALGQHTFCVSARGVYSGEASGTVCRTFKLVTTGSAPPLVTVTSPSFYGGSVGSSPFNIAYQVDGSTTIPSGTTCSINGIASTTPASNSTALSLGTNSIPVTCANATGSDTRYVTITRTTGFGVAITTPAPGLTTSSSSVNVTYNQLNINASIGCTLNGITTTSGSVNNVALPLGTSSIDLVCTSGGNVAKSSISVTRGNPPAVAITSPADNSSADSSANVSYTVDGSTSIPAGTTCRVNGVSSVDTTTNAVALAGGANLLTVSCSNAYGYNTATVTVNNVVVDTIPPAAPTLTLEWPNAPGNYSSQARIAYVGAESGGSFEGSLDGGAFQSIGASPVTTATVQPGDHTFSIRQVDAAGNAGSAATVTWNMLPQMTTPVITSGPSGYVSSTSATWEFTGTPEGGHDDCELSSPGAGGSSQTISPCTSPVSFSNLAQGTWFFCLTPVDQWGTRGSNYACAVMIVDTIAPNAPSVVLASPTSSPTASTTASIAVTPAEANGSVEGSLDGAPFAAITSPVSLHGLADGTHTYSARQTDRAGNVGSVTSVTWTVATTPAVVTITDGPADYVNTSSVQFSFTGSADGSTYNCQLDGGSSAPCSSPATFGPLADGSHTFCVTGVDTGGAPTTAACRNFVIDTVIPSVVVNSPLPAEQYSLSPKVFFTTSDSSPLVLTTCAFDGGVATPCSSPNQTSQIPQGAHTIKICATDAATNVGCALYSWSAPGPPLSVNVTGYPSSPTANTSATFVFNVASSLAGTTTRCSLDSQAYATCSSPVNYTQLAEGTHTFCVKAADALGNEGNPTCVGWTISNPPPVVTITSGPTGTQTSNSATFTFISNITATTFQCSLDGGPYTACTSPKVYTGLTTATHTFCVRGTSPTGVVGPASCRTWTIAITPPPTANCSLSGNILSCTFSLPGAGWSATCRLDGGAATACTSPVAWSVANGTHTVTICFTDPSGIVGCQSFTFTAPGSGGGGTTCPVGMICLPTDPNAPQ